MKRIVTTLYLLFIVLTVYAQKDSIRIVSLLKDGAKQSERTCLPLYYAERLKGVPYVGQTLEINKTEQLVVNVHQLDCTTLVETCVALVLTTQQGSTQYADYCRNLTRIRYRGFPKPLFHPMDS